MLLLVKTYLKDSFKILLEMGLHNFHTLDNCRNDNISSGSIIDYLKFKTTKNIFPMSSSELIFGPL
jgi:hypothetical protein